MTDVLTTRSEIDALISEETIATGFAATVADQGDNPAYSDKVGIEPGSTDWRTLSWNQLRERALDVTSALIELGVEPGDRIALMASNRIEHVLADIGAMHAGAIAMSIYNTLSSSQVSYVAGHAL